MLGSEYGCFGDWTTQLGVFCVVMEHNTPCSDSGGDRYPHVETTGNQHVKIINSQGRWQA